MKKLLFTAFFASFALGLFAQFQHRCGYDHAVQYKDELHPGFKERADEIFRQAKQMAELRGGGTYIVPLVFHVVWKTPAEKLAECKIIEQVDILNRAYQRQNPDTANLRAVFSSVVANPNISFRLDSIIWHQTDSIFYSGGFLPDIGYSDRVKHSSNGGSDAINTTNFLNIWVCNLGSSGILGYAYPPAGLSNWPANSQAPTAGDDGVVLDYRIVGAEGTYVQQSTTINTKGNAAVHEVGHYLGLRHIWGDGLLSLLGFPDCNADDGVVDTPNSGLPSNYMCDSTQNTCGAGTAGDKPDMIENFMDYSEESCQNSYTFGQVTIMHGVLNSERVGLSGVPALHPTVRPDNDALPHALQVAVNLDNNCTVSVNSANTGASPSMSACSGAGSSNDVWFSFNAVSTEVVVNVSNVQATVGSGTDMVYEVLGGTCGNLQTFGCFTSLNNTVSGLNIGDDYLIRVYSADAASSQSFNLCLQAAGVLALTQNEKLSEINVYPNPSTGVFNVKLPSGTDISGFLTVKNLLGQQLSADINIDSKNENLQIDLSTLSNGVYLFEFQINGNRIVKKAIVRK